MEELLKQILAEQKKTNEILLGFIKASEKAQKKAFETNEMHKKQAFEMVSSVNPKVAEMMKGFMRGAANGD